ncbi:hypothetical protein KUM39_23735 [Streptomyces sp. J2-1]|uniref:hypothetical protein n=1 Tax=Streptomyces corallincola TaxID=2851888 RepID=UPI001C380FDA|nr:hypothetical protein [Streptomyces corallincola]MBV2357346.1 hypothetical protein [Streptomyces corallincola]
MMALGCWITALPGFFAAFTGVLVMGLGTPGAVVGLYTTVQRHSPAHLQGRVAAAASMLATAPQVLAVATGAWLITRVDYRFLLVGMGVVIGVSALYLALRTRKLTAQS